MHVMILGCGRMGAALARDLDRKGHRVTVIDAQNDAFARLGPDFTGRKAQGDGIDVDDLRRIGLDDVDAFVACTSGDNRNLTASQIAYQVFQVPRVVSRVSDPLRGEIFAELGIRTVSPTVLGADMIFHALLDNGSLVDCN
jgi:trk system potassium uptake protein TrkA